MSKHFIFLLIKMDRDTRNTTDPLNQIHFVNLIGNRIRDICTIGDNNRQKEMK